MKTQAEKQFDADYKILRHLFITCRRTESVEKMKTRIRHLAVVALHELDTECNSDEFIKKMKRQSGNELNELNWLKDKDEL